MHSLLLSVSHQNASVWHWRSRRERSRGAGQAVSECTSAVTGSEHPSIPSIYNWSLQQAMSKAIGPTQYRGDVLPRECSFLFGDAKCERSFGELCASQPFLSLGSKAALVPLFLSVFLLDVQPFLTVYQQHPCWTDRHQPLSPFLCIFHHLFFPLFIIIITSCTHINFFVWWA